MENINVNEIDMHHFIQPIVNLDDKQVYGYEFLLRSNPSINPELLFAFASKQNQLVQLDKKSIFKILDVLKQNIIDGFHLFINIFPSTLLDPYFHRQLKEFISEYSIEPNSIVLEINEAENINNIYSLKEACYRLKEQGFLIAIDDIGKGTASMKMILELEPDIAKVDRYFTKDISKSPQKQKLVQFLLDFFTKNTKVVLEGFESEEDINTAKKLGVFYGQGYYLGKPKPIQYYFPNFK